MDGVGGVAIEYVTPFSTYEMDGAVSSYVRLKEPLDPPDQTIEPIDRRVLFVL